MDSDSESAAFSQALRQRARQGRFTVGAEEENPIVAAMEAHSAALATGSDDEIKAAREKVEQLMADHRESQRLDWGAGARPQPQVPASMTELIRRARWSA